MTYQQLTQQQRYQIYALMKAGFNHTQIASEIDALEKDFKAMAGAAAPGVIGRALPDSN